MAVSSNDVRSLNEIIVTLNLITTNKDGTKTRRPVEMTLAQFKVSFTKSYPCLC